MDVIEHYDVLISLESVFKIINSEYISLEDSPERGILKMGRLWSAFHRRKNLAHSEL